MRKQQSEEGIALLIAIFVLLLIGVVAIALVVSSGTESALAGNYRSSTTVYYAAVAGLEEVRARLRPNSLNSFNNTTAPGTFLPPAGTALGVCNPVYVINPLGGEAVTPWDPANSYYDGEFSTEFPLDCGGNPPPSPSPTTQSIWNQNPLSGLPFPGPFYKWVRINGVTEKSLNLDVSPYDTVVENKLLYYNGTNFTDLNNGQPQVLELTALAVLPNGSQKMVQYLVAPLAVNLPTFPAALTLLTGPGNNVTFNATTDPGTNVRGVDQDSVVSCSPSTVTPLIPAIGVSTNPDRNSVVNGVPVGARNHYTGSGLPPSPSPPPGSGPDVQIVTGSFPANLDDSRASGAGANDYTKRRCRRDGPRERIDSARVDVQSEPKSNDHRCQWRPRPDRLEPDGVRASPGHRQLCLQRHHFLARHYSGDRPGDGHGFRRRWW